MNRFNSLFVYKIVYGLLVTFMAVGLKYAYSKSTSEDLAWILGPTASLVGLLTGEQFANEANIGYVSSGLQVAIIPACAGVNFMIAAYCMTAFALLYAANRKACLPVCILATGAGAYGATLITNSLRILLSVYLYRADIYTVFFTPERVHRLAGIGIYFVCLCLLYLGVRKITSAKSFFQEQHQKAGSGIFISSLSAFFTPLIWYLLVALALPVLNQAAGRNPALFREHAESVLAVSLLLFVMMFIGVMCYKFKKQQNTGYSHEDAHSDCG